MKTKEGRRKIKKKGGKERKGREGKEEKEGRKEGTTKKRRGNLILYERIKIILVSLINVLSSLFPNCLKTKMVRKTVTYQLG